MAQTALAAGDPALNPQVLAVITELNQHLAATGEPIEGNVCYWHETPPERFRVEPPTDDPHHMSKRANLASLVRDHDTMLEIGLNGGHSALICLTANPLLHFFSVDIVGHNYTNVAADFLKARFGRRFHFFRGDSREVLPRLAVEKPTLKFDLIHVDGGHGVDLAYTDISNGLRMAAKDAELLFDDINAPQLDAVVMDFIAMGYLKPCGPGRLPFPNVLHDLFKVCVD